MTCTTTPQEPTQLEEFALTKPLPTKSGQAELFLVQTKEFQEECLLKLYYPFVELHKIKGLKSLSKDYALTPLKTGTLKGRPYELYEWLPLGSLRNELSSPKTEEWMLDFVSQITQAIVHIHSKGIIHADIKPENILRKKTGENIQYLLCDFGSAKPTEVSQTLTQVAASPKYIAPEAALSSPSKASDYYSLGVILMEALLGKHPLEALDTKALLMHAASGTAIDTSKIKEPWRELLTGLTHPNTSERWNHEHIQSWLLSQTRPPQTEMPPSPQTPIDFATLDEGFTALWQTRNNIPATNEDETDYLGAALQWCSDLHHNPSQPRPSIGTISLWIDACRVPIHRIGMEPAQLTKARPLALAILRTEREALQKIKNSQTKPKSSLPKLLLIGLGSFLFCYSLSHILIAITQPKSETNPQKTQSQQLLDKLNTLELNNTQLFLQLQELQDKLRDSLATKNQKVQETNKDSDPSKLNLKDPGPPQLTNLPTTRN
jgi:serine/threonine protein kinase